ncbi:MAG: Lrp/AsnC family transcriptional regulator [Planctomycetota bacterium]|nr:MAG: Lrp/AsnC family transcriptional regulator [Planctomycetota bacterium]
MIVTVVFLYNPSNGKKMDLNNCEKKVLAAIQQGMPISVRPYQDLADIIGIPVRQLLDVLRQWKADKRIRRLGAIVNHFQMGHGVGAMVVWNVPEDRVDQIGRQFASVAKVSHAYWRPPKQQWPYTLYTMVHATSDGELEQTIRQMSQQSGVTKFRALKTIKELKKVPPTYIIEK